MAARSRVDTAIGVHHPSYVLTFGPRLIALFLTAVMAAGNAAVCEGWASTPEARMDCCTGDHPCPMHRTESDGAGATRVVTQAQADSCCAFSEQEQSGQSAQVVAAATPAVERGSGIVVPPATPRLVLTDSWRTSAPMPSPPLHRHVLLSVFLL